jgi:hypothetical protein
LKRANRIIEGVGLAMLPAMKVEEYKYVSINREALGG